RSGLLILTCTKAGLWASARVGGHWARQNGPMVSGRPYETTHPTPLSQIRPPQGDTPGPLTSLPHSSSCGNGRAGLACLSPKYLAGHLAPRRQFRARCTYTRRAHALPVARSCPVVDKPVDG